MSKMKRDKQFRANFDSKPIANEVQTGIHDEKHVHRHDWIADIFIIIKSNIRFDS